MDKDLINTYAYGNLHKALLRQMFISLFLLQEEVNRNPEDGDRRERSNSRKQRLTVLENTILKTLAETDYPPNQPHSEEIRARTAQYARMFFDEVEERLVQDIQPNSDDVK